MAGLKQNNDTLPVRFRVFAIKPFSGNGWIETRWLFVRCSSLVLLNPSLAMAGLKQALQIY